MIRHKPKPEKYLGPLARSKPRTHAQHTAAERRRYRKDGRAFTAGLRAGGVTCPVLAAFYYLPPEVQAVLTVPWTGNRRSDKITETHHKYGRAGKLLNWQGGWLGVSKFGHRAIHAHIAEARKHGWICEKGLWNNQKLAEPTTNNEPCNPPPH